MTIPFHVPHQTGREAQLVEQAIDSGDFGVRGSASQQATSMLEGLLGVGNHVLLTHSCTAALELMALAIDVKPGDQVIVPSYTFSSTASAFLRSGAEIVFADIDRSTLSLDPKSVEQMITPNTKAVVAVHYAGLPGHIAELKSLLADHPAHLLEDAAQSIGASLGDNHLGTLGSMGAISFHFTKNIHSGFGGALVMSEEVDRERVEHMWERGTDRSRLLRGEVDRYTWVELGSSFSMDGIHAAFLAAQLDDLPGVTASRKAIFDIYQRAFRELEDAHEGVELLTPNSDVISWNYHAAVAAFLHQEQADHVRQFLADRGAVAYIGYVPLHDSPYGSSLSLNETRLPVTETMAPRVLRLPIHTSMSRADAELVSVLVGEALDSFDQ